MTTYRLIILTLSLLAILVTQDLIAQKRVDVVSIDCFGETMTYEFTTPITVDTRHPNSEAAIIQYCHDLESQRSYENLVSDLKSFSKKHQLDDWLYYQLIRRVADQLAPKSEDYILYTLFKWHLLSLSGFDAILTYSNEKILFYALSHENIYNIPMRKEGDKTYVCLNYHDYGKIDFSHSTFRKIDLKIAGADSPFSYKVKTIPELKKTVSEKELHFSYNNSDYRFRVKLNPSIATYFRNYPVTDYEKHFNIPLSSDTYNSLIPALKKAVRGLTPKNGTDFLMHFTRYAFLFKPDTETFGTEKILSPEMTLLSESSDCEDRVSLFYYLVKEIYDLPMIVMVYPKHVSIAVQFDKAYGKTIDYKGKKFTVCEPSPQEEDLRIGQTVPALAHTPYQVVFAYEPSRPHR